MRSSYGSAHAVGNSTKQSEVIVCRAVKKGNCYHFSGTTKDDPDNPCTFSQTPWIIFMGALQIVFSQIQDIDR